MAKQVPVTTQLGETLDAGSAVQFSGGSVEPMQNKMPGQIQKQSTAMLQMQKAAQSLADQLNDAEATQLYNEFYPELENNHNSYLEKKGLDAVSSIPPVEEGGEYNNQLDLYKNDNLKNLLEKYTKKASNGSVKYMFETKASQAIADSQNKMIQHSIKQQTIGATEVLTNHLEITKREVVNDYEKWNVPGSVYETRKYVGMALIDEIAMVNGWNIDPSKGRVSSQYIDLRSKYLYEISTGVVDMMRKNGIDNQIIKAYIQTYSPELGEQTTDNLLEINKNEALVHNLSKCVEATLRDNGNTNDGSYISSANKLYCLSSSNQYDDGKGAGVTEGLHSDEVDITEKSISDNMEMTEQILNSQSKFYRPDSELNGTLINQHKTTHIFAALHLGVEKADSLYTKAKSELNIDPKQYKNNPVYAKNINAKIITNYKKLIIEEANKKYRPEILRLENEIKIAEEKKSNMKSKGVYVQKRKDLTKKINQLKNQLEVANVEDPKFVEKIISDLDILESEINYDYDPQITSKLQIDTKSGLQPLSVLEQKLRATIKDPKELEVALKDLRIKHNDITNASNKLYEEELNKAKTIAFARKGGHEDLIENGIDITKFDEEDQKILKNGQPETSDLDTVIMLNDNPGELKDNLSKYSYKLNKLDYMKLEEYASTLNNDATVRAVKIDNKLFELTINKKGFANVINSKGDEEQKTNYLELLEEWKRLIDEEQIRTDKTLTRERKKEILENLLDDKVLTGEGEKINKNFFGFGGEFVGQPRTTLNDDQLTKAYVEINGEQIMLSSINGYIRAKITRKLQAKGINPTSEAIASYWVLAGRPTADNDFDYRIWNNKQMSSTQK